MPHIVEKLSKLKVVCAGKPGLYTGAMVFFKNSIWTLDNITKYIAVTGKVPENDMANIPTETLTLLCKTNR